MKKTETKTCKHCNSEFTITEIDSYFLYDCRNCQNCFMCWNLRGKSYCIENKQYTREEYLGKLKSFNLGSYKSIQNHKNHFEEIIRKEIVHRQNFNLKVYNSDGNYFSTSFVYFPETKKEDILKLGGYWEDINESNVEGMPTSELPDDIKDVSDDITTRALICPKTGWRFNIAQNELIFYRENNIPLPRYHFDVRIKNNLKYLTILQSYPYKCFYCKNDIQAYYLPEWGYQKIACEECYKQNIN